MDETPPTKDHMLGSGTYDQLKFVAQIVLPAIGTLYFTLASIWGLPSAQEVVGSIMAVDTFLGVLLSLSTRSYEASNAKYDGHVNVVPDEDEETTNLSVSLKPESLGSKDEVLLKVNKNK